MLASAAGRAWWRPGQVKELQAELAKRGMKVYGKHDDLAQRLKAGLRRDARLSPAQEAERNAALAELAAAQVADLDDVQVAEELEVRRAGGCCLWYPGAVPLQMTCRV